MGKNWSMEDLAALDKRRNENNLAQIFSDKKNLIPFPKKEIKFEESLLQQKCVKWFDDTYPEFKLNLFSIPNERRADVKTTKSGKTYSPSGARMKAQGRRKGVADLFLAVPIDIEILSNPNRGDHGMFIEFKTDSGKQSVEQMEFEKCVVSKGYSYIIIRTFESFKEVIEKYLS